MVKARLNYYQSKAPPPPGTFPSCTMKNGIASGVPAQYAIVTVRRRNPAQAADRQ
jgi:hypothetical protein